MRLRISQFTVEHDLASDGLVGQTLLFNTRSGKSCVVDSAAWIRVRTLLPTGDMDQHLSAILVQLKELAILIDDADDERLSFTTEFDQMRFHPREIYPLLAVTTSCNIACTYCYEAGVSYESMGPDVISATLEWLDRRATLPHIEAIHPGLFGGEPLLRRDALRNLMSGFREIVNDRGIRGNFYCSSNGLLLDDDYAQELSDLGLDQIQISIDGTKVAHDERRVGHRGQPTFERSLNALNIATRWIRNVSLKINFDLHNLESIPEMLTELKEAGFAQKVDVKLEAVALQLPGSRVTHSPSYITDPRVSQLAKQYEWLAQAARNLGFRVNPETAHTTPCMLTVQDGVIIGPDGAIYKCISMVGRADQVVGSVFDDVNIADRYAEMMELERRLEPCWEENCQYIPVCMGGCIYEGVARGGTHRERFCTKEFLSELHLGKNLRKVQSLLGISTSPKSPVPRSMLPEVESVPVALVSRRS